MDLASAFPTTVEHFEYPNLGKVVKTISSRQKGRVKFRGTYWFARFEKAPTLGKALPGTFVEVVGREGLTLLVSSTSPNY